VGFPDSRFDRVGLFTKNPSCRYNCCRLREDYRSSDESTNELQNPEINYGTALSQAPCMFTVELAQKRGFSNALPAPFTCFRIGARAINRLD
jgi:hypothetical protein